MAWYKTDPREALSDRASVPPDPPPHAANVAPTTKPIAIPPIRALRSEALTGLYIRSLSCRPRSESNSPVEPAQYRATARGDTGRVRSGAGAGLDHDLNQETANLTIRVIPSARDITGWARGDLEAGAWVLPHSRPGPPGLGPRRSPCAPPRARSSSPPIMHDAWDTRPWGGVTRYAWPWTGASEGRTRSTRSHTCRSRAAPRRRHRRPRSGRRARCRPAP